MRKIACLERKILTCLYTIFIKITLENKQNINNWNKKFHTNLESLGYIMKVPIFHKLRLQRKLPSIFELQIIFQENEPKKGLINFNSN